MKNLILITLALLAAPCILHAQPYSIDWHKVSGGGGTSSSGVYSVTGTIGQHDAGGPMTGGNFSLTGGFWAIYAVQTPGAPQIIITAAGPNQATISWTPNSPGYLLQSTDSLSPANWVNAPSGTNNPVIVAVNVPARFYRLFHP